MKLAMIMMKAAHKSAWIAHFSAGQSIKTAIFKTFRCTERQFARGSLHTSFLLLYLQGLCCYDVAGLLIADFKDFSFVHAQRFSNQVKFRVRSKCCTSTGSLGRVVDPNDGRWSDHIVHIEGAATMAAAARPPPMATALNFFLATLAGWNSKNKYNFIH